MLRDRKPDHLCTRWRASLFYRSNAGAEIDLLLTWTSGELWAIEIKRSLTPKLERGFYAACTDLKPTRKFVVYPGTERYRIAADIEAISLALLVLELNSGNPIDKNR
uniref:DUF4143 domain-containing protein n=1 Tax=mine drainage metagenome TaxID=410659 RepID=E6QTW6_9ZZZZ